MIKKKKKIPLRMCIGCREMKEKRALIRIVKNKENEIKVDLSGKMNGRGAYLCKNADCLEKAIKNRGLSREFECRIPETVYEEIQGVVEKNIGS